MIICAAVSLAQPYCRAPRAQRKVIDMTSPKPQSVSRLFSVIAASLVLLASGAVAQPQQSNEAKMPAAAFPFPKSPRLTERSTERSLQASAGSQETLAAGKGASFYVHRDFPVPDFGPPAQGDLNGDGIVDLVVPGGGGNNVMVLLGNADATFQAPVSADIGAGAAEVAIADFNGDGIQDIAATTTSGVSIILGEGGGKFGPPQIVPAGTNPQGIVAADFNGDHRLDLAVANSDSNNVSVFLGQGDGTFTESETIAVGAGPLGIAATDFNGDGHVDLVVSNSAIFGSGPNGNTIAILLGTGKGTFDPAVFLPMKGNPEGIAVGDFNKDGRTDLVVALVSTDDVAELLGNGDGTFQAARFINAFPGSGTSPGVGIGPANIALADFNGDGNVDLAVVNSLTSTVGVLLGDGTGTFKPTRGIEVGRTPGGILTGDYNHDGKPDFISSNADASSISVVLGNGDGTFVEAPAFPAGGRPQDMVMADFNNDGVPDLATLSLSIDGPQSVSVLLGKPGGGFQPVNTIPIQGSISFLAAADINQDGHVDLLATNAGTTGGNPGGLIVLLGKGDGTFQPAMNVPVSGKAGAIVVADFNGDGKLDAVISNSVSSAESLVFLPGDGKGGFGVPSNIITFKPLDLVTFLLTADFNGDGKPDVAFVDVAINATLSVKLGNGDGTFGPAKVVTTVPPTSSIFAVAIGDFNNDGIADFAVEEGGVIEMLVGDGKGNFVSKGMFPESNLSSFAFIAALVVADFNGDGLLDVAAADGFSDNIVLFPGNGDGTLGALTLFGGGHTAAALSADFSGDGRPDIALATTAPTAKPTSAGEVILLLNTTPK